MTDSKLEGIIIFTSDALLAQTLDVVLKLKCSHVEFNGTKMISVT